MGGNSDPLQRHRSWECRECHPPRGDGHRRANRAGSGHRASEYPEQRMTACYRAAAALTTPASAYRPLLLACLESAPRRRGAGPLLRRERSAPQPLVCSGPHPPRSGRLPVSTIRTRRRMRSPPSRLGLPVARTELVRARGWRPVALHALHRGHVHRGHVRRGVRRARRGVGVRSTRPVSRAWAAPRRLRPGDRVRFRTARCRAGSA